MLYEALTGELPYEGPVQQLLSRKLFTDPPAPRAQVPETPDDLNELCLQLLCRDAAQRPGGAAFAELFPVQNPVGPSVAPEPPHVRAPLVGRSRELELLRSAFDVVSERGTVLVTVSGESGIGKSALVEAFANEIRGGPGVVALFGRCYEYESLPYKAFDQIADALGRFLSRCTETEAALCMPRDPLALATLFPALGRVSTIGAPTAKRSSVDATQLRRAGFAAFKELLCRLADRYQLVLAIDDVQWSDADSALLFKSIFDADDPPACLLVTTWRGAAPDAFRVGTGGGPGIRQVELELGALSAEESRELVRHVGQGRLERQAAIDRIASEARGNPFFVMALTRNALENAEGRASLSSLMHRWFHALPPGAFRLLSVIAIAGRPVEAAAVAEVAETENVDAELSVLASQHMIRGWPTPSRLVECYHDQIREAADAYLTADERSRLHARLARVFEARGPVDAQQIAQHFIAAGERGKGSHYAERAAEQACEALAFLEAAQWYERALDNVLDDPDRTCSLRTKLGEALAGAGRAASASHWLLEATSSAPAEKALELRQRAAELLLVSGHVDQGIAVLGDVLRHFGMSLAPTPRRALGSLLCQRAIMKARGLGFVERRAETLDSVQLLKIDACWSVALGLSLVDNIRAADFQTRNLRFSLESGEPYRVARALAMEAAFRATGGSRSEQSAKRLSDAATKLAESLENRHATALTTLIAGLLHYLVGRWQAASELLARAEQTLLGEPGAIWELHAAQRFRLNALTYLGDLLAIAQEVPELVNGARERGNLYAECYLRVRLRSILSLANDDPEEAIEEANDVMGRWSQGGFHLQHYNELYALVSAALYQGRAMEAMERMRSTWPRLQASLMLRTQAIRVEAHHLRTRVCLSYLQHVGPDRAVRKLLEADIRTLHSERVPWASAFASFAQGLYHAVSNEPERAERALGIAERELAAGDMRLFAAATHWRRGQLQGGEVGRVMIDKARRSIEVVQIKNPERFLAHYAPGL